MIEINLIPDVKQELLKAQRTRLAVISGSIIASLVAGGVVALLLIYIFAVQAIRDNILNGQITNNASQFLQTEDLSKMLTIQNQLTKISSLNQEKNIDSRLFDLLSAVTPTGANKVSFSNVAIDSETSTIRVEGQTTSYESLEVFKKTLAGAVIQYTEKDATEPTITEVASNISTNEASYGQDAEGTKVLRFSMTFTYADELFAVSTPNPVFKLNINGNVTDSYLGIPKSLFTEKAKDL